MDFVVIGLGLSALALLTGLALLCLVAPHWFRKAGAAQPGDAAYARAQAGARRALGQGCLCVGAILLLSTLGGISAGLTDKSGAYLIATMATLAMLGLFGWDLLYRRQHPVPARRRPATRALRSEPDERAAQQAAKPVTSHATTTKVRRRVLPARQRVVPAEVPAIAMEAPLEARHGEDAVQADRPETAESSEPQADVSDLTEPQAPDPEHESERPTLEESSALAPASVEQEESAGVPDSDTAEPPQPGTQPTSMPNGSTEPDAFSPSPAEPEVLPHGDDRVIALFPTAAAQRGRAVVAPPDSNGQR